MKDENMDKAYVEWRDEGYWIVNTRVSLDTIVYAFLDGQSPENIAQSLPVESENRFRYKAKSGPEIRPYVLSEISRCTTPRFNNTQNQLIMLTLWAR